MRLFLLCLVFEIIILSRILYPFFSHEKTLLNITHDKRISKVHHLILYSHLWIIQGYNDSNLKKILITENGTHRSSTWGNLFIDFSGEDKLLLSTSRANSNYVFIDVSNVTILSKKMKVNWVNCILNGRHSFFLSIIWITQVLKSNFRIPGSPNVNYCRTNSIPRSSGDLQRGRVQSPGKQLSKVYKQRLTFTQVSLNELLFIKKIIKSLKSFYVFVNTSFRHYLRYKGQGCGGGGGVGEGTQILWP